ncbi:Transmembrane protein 97 [Tieghemiomyces parasiticus]|uniref:Transmembrane protein 97 n=1 Tax=Tieghemiomyces parasiticus TaxID=78921 RepID=A0A9W8AA32_9FUNG|nr:Transmembrane protein 97 [Tieghemiomyces parasiticus]
MFAPSSSNPGRRLLDRPLDLAFFIYFVVHIPTTIFIDSQILLPSAYVPAALNGLIRFWIDLSGDPFIQLDGLGLVPGNVWFQTFVACELLIQLPFFFYAAFGLYRDAPGVRLPLGLYGAHVATTVLPILTSVWFGEPQLGGDQRLLLTAVYVPYFVVPLLMVAQALYRATCTAYSGSVSECPATARRLSTEKKES